jgi:1-acyl-sn-glycerol-3-phosphate acyltransferase
VAFSAASGVAIVPVTIVGSTLLWFRRSVRIRFAEPIPTAGARDRAARAAVEARVRDAMQGLLPRTEPPLPRRRALRFVGDLLTGADDLARRRTELGE